MTPCPGPRRFAAHIEDAIFPGLRLTLLWQTNQRFLHKLGPLLDCGWLARQPADFIDWLAHAGSWRSYAGRHVLYGAGDEPDALYGLGSGVLEVSLPVIGEEAVTIHRAEPGFWIGESALLAHTSRSISLMVAADSRVFSVPAATIRAAVAERPAFWAASMRSATSTPRAP